MGGEEKKGSEIRLQSERMADSCLAANPTTGEEWKEISCIYPALKSIVTNYESEYDPVPLHSFMKENWYFPYVIVVMYLTLVFYGQNIVMKDRESLKGYRNIMAVWNLALSIFSFIGTIRLFPYGIHNIVNMSAEDLFCHNARSTFGFGSTGLWILLFTLSKTPELIDTFFIVIHKKKLIFLHWYHHASVVFATWSTYVDENPICIYFCLLNYWVHSIMYFYYFLTAMQVHKNPRLKWIMPNPIFITFFQILQMVIGTTLTVANLYYYFTVPTCNVKANNIALMTFIYASYLVLFCQFFIGRYFVKVQKKNKKM